MDNTNKGEKELFPSLRRCRCCHLQLIWSIYFLRELGEIMGQKEERFGACWWTTPTRAGED